MTTATDLLVDRTDLHESRLQTREVECADGEALFEIERFALTANNITYAVAGDSAFGYWKFFPAPDHWGRVPVWGFARVSASRHPDVAVGERFYGYFPMGTHLVVKPQRVGPSGFVDGAPHRAALPPVYNQYTRATGDRHEETAQMLLRPLFMTSFLLDDFLADNDFFGARRVILSSASSKTSLGLAFELARNRKGRVTVAGLTAPSQRRVREAPGLLRRSRDVRRPRIARYERSQRVRRHGRQRRRVAARSRTLRRCVAP